MWGWVVIQAGWVEVQRCGWRVVIQAGTLLYSRVSVVEGLF